MTTYTFVPSSSRTVDWSTPSAWSGGVVPNAADADVVIPPATGVQSGDFITLSAPVGIRSLSITGDTLSIGAALTVSGDVVDSGGIWLTSSGALSVGGDLSLVAGAQLISSAGGVTMGSCANGGLIEGVGPISCSGTFTNNGQLNVGNGVLTLTVTPGDFTNLSAGTLTGGAYETGASGVLDMNVGGVVTVDAANISLFQGAEIAFWDSGKAAYVPIESTLQSVAASGTLALDGYTGTWGAVSVDGLMQLADGAHATFSQLTIDAGGRVVDRGSATTQTLSGPIVDNGTIIAGVGGVGGSLKLDGPVSGSGTVEIATALVTSPMGSFGGAYGYNGCSLELGAAFSATVAFDDSHGTLILDDPSAFTGKIAPSAAGGDIVLEGISDSSVTGWSYSGDRTGGVLEIDLSDGSHLDLDFVGDFSAKSFSLSAGPQGQSSGPPSLEIVNSGLATPAHDLVRDDFTGAGVSDILIENTSGAVVLGHVVGGQESYTTVAALGPEWSFRGTGDFLGDGKTGFLIENTNGHVDVAEVSGGATTYTQVAALGPEWHFAGTGEFFGAEGLAVSSLNPSAPNYVGAGQDWFLIENTAGQLDVGTVVSGQADYVQIDQLGSEWKVLGAGAFLGDGKAQFVMENSSGLVEVGDVQADGTVSYSQVAALGSEWKYVGAGDVLGDGKAQFLIENAAGALVAADIGTDGKAHFTTLAGLGPEWTVQGVGDYLGGSHDQVVMENTSGAVVIGDWSGGQVHWTQVGQLGSEWSFHG